MLYQRLAKPLLFMQDPERVHEHATRLGIALGASPLSRSALAAIYDYEHPVLEQTVAGIAFRNPVGLAAGFDKDCNLMDVLPSIGFGFEEVGSITAEPYGGNSGKRLVRLPEDAGIIVNYGLKNKGARALRKKLKKKFAIPIGVSVAMTNRRFANEREKLEDWALGITLLKDSGSYLTINLSCPNTSDPASFCDPDLLEKLLCRIDTMRFEKPVFLKLRNDLSQGEADRIIDLCASRPWVTGFILSNLSKDRSRLKDPQAHAGYPGGVSGRTVKPGALRLTRHFRERAGDRFVLVGCGGIFTSEDAYDYLVAGASLVQLVTGMIYKGPGVVSEINRGLVRLLRRDGFESVSQAIGTKN